ncbi:FAS1-like dehydratase domain-containing protein [Bordetella avium]|uniref:FAS1-like dehydratase domain-containing protein n=1 Tax=Bordetella avium TaxID=521 RepID=UPI000E0A2897|nr:MaoC family dehydratase N-terminal domain-containing protein [Bordetella avium]RIQ13500.1 itaconyl-CoA hydratase [Bordetella avium]RIQ36845.1 itaconyl-CoA hydratase [Bordetella avium]RIQ40689.1 itaconyl-CoA hydratase [Bordetella avium]RIQ42485.1 itaconyl-CoA hydratase [Bordetella avium]RIQ48217.1 itaconyl-CoA hydratase [Bordetella avium]
MSEQALEQWLGKTEHIADTLDPAHAQRIAATLGAPLAGDALPPLWQWAYFIKAVDPCGIGLDGHPARGGFLPPADGRNRMWAGGRVNFHSALRIGLPAERVSTVMDIQEKTGRTGQLLFVTVRHEYLQDGRVAISEEQDIVYRQPTPPKLQGSEPAAQGQWRETIAPDAVLLFRYSAVTFNGHRIHYDHPYVTEVEGYPGLVVHGPLIATSMLAAFCRAHPAARLKHYAYRGLRPLISPQAFEVSGLIEAPGQARLWAAQDGTLAHQAELRFEA